MLRIIFTVILFAFAQASMDLDFQWLNLGHGLHPAIAFPLATICMVLILCMVFISANMAAAQHRPRRGQH